ncbi:Bis(5'-nucleosyl)-tetraphosphatase [symmetrical] [Kingella potus]|uniref:bis(5'-nucleosyl)-tetraphosphatase (symmetrical) n=1 Tax=Kingella potus TaxID=265175 RepID=A0A377R1J5_9NEIS|nr:symmetrical bis(5'-nucleosyl)-tetraphosphatase [Kingella potus]STR00959.1 Bis(5'-nucleosyl)-tetraphosphatase [symmetrical] [Kingella potus]
MAHYAIGDIQGCFDEFQALLHKTGFCHGRDTLWLTGDIVNRGPKSLETLKYCMKHESSVHTVLGNHDLHLLAILYGQGRTKRSDTLDPVIRHKHAAKMRDWLRSRPLLLQTDSHLMTHAGLPPQWNTQQAAALAAEVEHHLRGSRPAAFFAAMYGNKPAAWHEGLAGADRLRFITNAFTRMRALHADGSLDFAFKSTLSDLPPGLCAWFDHPARRRPEKTVVFGHWSALGLIDSPEKNILSLDTGALWGGCLTAADLASHTVFQEPAHSREK